MIILQPVRRFEETYRSRWNLKVLHILRHQPSRNSRKKNDRTETNRGSLLFKIDGYRRMDASTFGHSPQNKQATAVENKDQLPSFPKTVNWW